MICFCWPQHEFQLHNVYLTISSYSGKWITKSFHICRKILYSWARIVKQCEFSLFTTFIIINPPFYSSFELLFGTYTSSMHLDFIWVYGHFKTIPFLFFHVDSKIDAYMCSVKPANFNVLEWFQMRKLFQFKINEVRKFLGGTLILFIMVWSWSQMEKNMGSKWCCLRIK